MMTMRLIHGLQSGCSVEQPGDVGQRADGDEGELARLGLELLVEELDRDSLTGLEVRLKMTAGWRRYWLCQPRCPAAGCLPSPRRPECPCGRRRQEAGRPSRPASARCRRRW